MTSEQLKALFDQFKDEMKVNCTSNMFIMKNNKPGEVKVFPFGIRKIVVDSYRKNIDTYVSGKQFCNFKYEKGNYDSVQVIDADKIERWKAIVEAKSNLNLKNIKEIKEEDYSRSGNVILIEVTSPTKEKAYYLSFYQNVASWYRKALRIRRLGNEFAEEKGEILAITPYPDALIFRGRCFIINENNFLRIFKFEEIVKNIINKNKVEIEKLKFVCGYDKFFHFVDDSHRMKAGLARAIDKKRIEQFQSYTAEFIRSRLQGRAELINKLTFNGENKIIPTKDSAKIIVGILSGSINLDLITDEINGLE